MGFKNISYTSRMAAKKTIGSIDVEVSFSKARLLIQEEQEMMSALHALMEVMIELITLMMVNQLNLKSNNSNKPPFTDLHRLCKPASSIGRKRGGQSGHIDRIGEQFLSFVSILCFLNVIKKQRRTVFFL